jgi:hypothetical protein
MPRPKLATPNYRLRLRGNRYVVDWTDPISGRSKSVSTWQTEFGAAQVWFDQWLAGKEQPTPPSAPRVSAIVDAYMEARAPHVEEPRDMRYFGKTIARHVGNLEPAMLGVVCISSDVSGRE